MGAFPAGDKPFRDALRAEILASGQDYRALRVVAAALLAKAQTGDIQAVVELANRLDGKVPTAIVGDPNAPLEIRHISWLGDAHIIDVPHNGNGHVTQNGHPQAQIGPPTKVTITTREERKRIWAKAHMRRKRAEAKAAKLAKPE